MSLRKVAALLAAFGLMVGLVGIGSGVGAQFTDSVTAIQNISVGTFQCQIIAPSQGTISPDGTSVTYNAPPIESSAPSSAPFSFTVENTGSIPAVVSVTPSVPAAPFTSLPVAPAGSVTLTTGQTQLYSAGLQWPDLTNAELGWTVSITYTVNCEDAGGGGAGFPVGYYVVNDGGTQFAPGSWVRSTVPIATTAVVGGGNATQSVSGGHLNLAITGGGPYADNGFYVPLGTLASLASTGYTVTGTGSNFGTNVFFDVNNDGEFFLWSGNSLSGLGTDIQALGPTSVGGTLAVTGASTYDMNCIGGGGYGSYSLSTLALGGCTGITGSTKVAVWVGITSGGAALSTTITSAP